MKKCQTPSSYPEIRSNLHYVIMLKLSDFIDIFVTSSKPEQRGFREIQFASAFQFAFELKMLQRSLTLGKHKENIEEQYFLSVQ